METKIRTATTADVPRIVEILLSLDLARPEGLEKRIAAAIERSPDLCFAAEAGGFVTGVAIAAYNGFWAFLSHLAVDAKYQRAGTAALLHAKVAERAMEIGARGILTDSKLTSTGFFHRLGYRVPGAIFLVKEL